MSRLFTVLAALVLILAVPGALAEPRFSKSGGYKAGQPLTRTMDACALPGSPTEGVDSSCALLDAGLGGLPYSIVARNDLGSAVEVEVCFYQDRTFLSCGVVLIPPEANAFSVSSMAGLNVEWTFTVL